MTEIILIIMGICLLFYVLFGGADFGGGILELLTRGKASKIVGKAIAPVWEANHVWLILVVVILFVGFPPVYSTVLTALHIPVLLTLIGIILRGCAFTFRHYDIEEEKPKAIYSAIFRYSSLFTTFFLGVTLGGVILGDISMNYELGFFRIYIFPWFNFFCISMGIFMIILFAYLANIYTLGEIEDEKQILRFRKLGKFLLISLVVMGLIVFLSAEASGHSLIMEFYHSPVSIASMALATLGVPLLWRNLNRKRKNSSRIIAAAQTTFIVIGWFAIQFPILVRVSEGENITVYNAAAPEQTQFYMLIALVVGVLFIFPSLAYLYRTFKFKEETNS